MRRCFVVIQNNNNNNKTMHMYTFRFHGKGLLHCIVLLPFETVYFTRFLSRLFDSARL
jgi:hypothetical protein